MTKRWFSGTFCPRDANCGLGPNALTPSNGPKIRTMMFSEPQDDELLATIRQFKQTPDRDWVRCEGQLILISSNTSLFSLIGTLYGGDGRTTFGLPDLRNEPKDGMGDYYILISSIVASPLP